MNKCLLVLRNTIRSVYITAGGGEVGVVARGESSASAVLSQSGSLSYVGQRSTVHLPQTNSLSRAAFFLT